MIRLASIRVILLLIVFWITQDLSAQKKAYLVSQDEVVEAAIKAIEESMQNGDFQKFMKKTGIEGSYTMDITIKNKGEVASVRTIEREGEIKHQNQLKDFVITYKFPFKMPKDKSYKFRYEFKF